MRKKDLVARLADDAFVILLEDLNTASEAALVAEKIRARIEQPMDIERRALQVTISVGIGVLDARARAPGAAMARVDAALYEAKRAGRNRFMMAADAPGPVAQDAREALAAGLLTPTALREMVKDAILRRAAQVLQAGAKRASATGSKPLSMKEIQAEVKTVRRERKIKR